MHKRRTISQRSELIYDIHSFGINADTRELFLNPDYNVDNDYAEIDHRVAATLIKNIRFLNSQGDNPIVIHMCSCGGICEYGLAIYDAIRSSQSVVYVVAYAHARSMSSIILQAGDYRIVAANAYVMLHAGTDGYDGTCQGFITHAERAKKSYAKMIEIYVEKCSHGPYFKNKSELQIKNFINKQMTQKQEWYMSASEAINYGLADYILDDKNCPVLTEVINQ